MLKTIDLRLANRSLLERRTIYDERETATLEKETINTNADSELADKVFASLFWKPTGLTNFTSLRQRYFLNWFTWNDRRRKPSQEIGKSIRFERENLKPSLKQETRPVTWGGDK